MSDPRFPIGKFTFDGPPDAEQRQKFIEDIAQTPAALRAAVRGLTPEQIETPYRDGGWTVRQVIHHVPESHMNAYIRFKLALTEDAPTIKPYMEDRWAMLPDVQSTPLEVSLTPARFAARSLGAPVGRAATAGLEAAFQPPRVRDRATGKKSRPLLLARQASRSPHHRAQEEDGMVSTDPM
jgi:hypothetical protein